MELIYLLRDWVQRHWRKLKDLNILAIDLEKIYDRESCGRHGRIGEFVLLTFRPYVANDMYDEVKPTCTHTWCGHRGFPYNYRFIPMVNPVPYSFYFGQALQLLADTLGFVCFRSIIMTKGFHLESIFCLINFSMLLLTEDFFSFHFNVFHDRDILLNQHQIHVFQSPHYSYLDTQPISFNWFGISNN